MIKYVGADYLSMSNVSYIKLSTCNDLIIIDEDIFELFGEFAKLNEGC